MRQKEKIVWYEMARRFKQFHPNEKWDEIRLWGLFSWGLVSKLINEGKLLAPGYTRQNRTVWVFPTPESYHEYIEPLLSKSLDELTRLAGWC